jgi:magnesium chelatase family protein
MHIEVPRVPQELLTAPSPEDEPTSDKIRKRVAEAQKNQTNRQGYLNSKLSPKQVDEFCVLGSESQNLINSAMLKLGISARGYHRILKLARSIADLDKSDQIQQLHLAQAIQLRNLDRW